MKKIFIFGGSRSNSFSKIVASCCFMRHRPPAGARDLLTKLMSLFEPVVLIHDVQFSESDALHETFERTVEMWKQNCKKIFDAEYPLWTWRQLLPSYRMTRAKWLAVMAAANAAVSGSAAFKAWREAHFARGDEDE